MHDGEKTRSDLLAEVAQLRQRLTDLEGDAACAGEDALRPTHDGNSGFSAIFDHAVDGMALVDAHTWTCDVANRALAHLLGVTPTDVSGMRLEDIHPPEDWQRIRAEIAQRMDGPSWTLPRVRLMRRDGAVLFVDINIIRISLNGRQHLLGIFRDVTDRIEAERTVSEAQRELAETQTRYRDLMENVSDIIYSTDRDGTMTSVSQAAKRLLGFERKEIVGTHYRRWVPAEHLRSLEAARQTALQGQRTVTEVVLLDRAGTEHHMEISISPIICKGEVSGTQGIIRDITRRWQIEQIVRESEERLSGLFNAVTEVVLLIDTKGTVLALNETAARHLGRPIDVLVGTNLAEVSSEALPPEAIERRLRWIRQVVQRGQAMRVEDSLGDRVFDHSLYPVFDEEGRVWQVAMFSKDLSAQRHVEKALSDSEARYGNLVEGIVDVIVSLDRQGRIEWTNGVVTDLLGYDVAQVVGRHLNEFVRRDWHDIIHSQFQRVLAGESVRSETVLVAQDGAAVNVAYRAAPIVEKGHVVGVQCILWDVTQRTQLECRLRESEERYRTLVESAGEAIATVDRAGVFQFLNVEAARRLGATPKDLVGKTMWDIFPPDVADQQMEQIRQVLEAGQGRSATELSEVQGQRRWYNTTIVPLRDSTGAVASGLVIARDIHELKRAQDELEAYREKMMRAEQLASLGTLSATMAHELTQPLTVIRLSIQNSLKDLEKLSCPARVLEDLKDGLVEVSSVTAIAERFRNFARRSAGKIVKEVSMAEVAERVMELLGESARRSNVTLRAEGLETLPPLRMPEKDLEQLVFALAQNAIQAADRQTDAQFCICGVPKSDRVELRFTDNCGGMAAEHVPHVFEPFFTTKPAGEGTGLGLCIVQRVVSDAHGQIQVQTEDGQGTTFVVTLPIPED